MIETEVCERCVIYMQYVVLCLCAMLVVGCCGNGALVGSDSTVSSRIDLEPIVRGIPQLSGIKGDEMRIGKVGDGYSVVWDLNRNYDTIGRSIISFEELVRFVDGYPNFRLVSPAERDEPLKPLAPNEWSRLREQLSMQ